MKRISWKRGMRLSNDVLRASDECSAEMMGKAFVLAAVGRFGLLPSQRPFEFSLNFTQNIIDVESLCCLGITKGGDLIDVHYDTSYNQHFDTRVIIPEISGVEEYILTINIIPGQWKDTSDGFEEPVYTFSLISPDTPITEHSIPIGHVINDRGWRLDDVDFVPPCLFVSSHRKYEDLLLRFTDLLSMLDTKAKVALSSDSRKAISVFWPLVQQIRITVNKECDLMTPMSLLANVQKCVSAFTCACDIDETLELTDEKMYRNYALAPYTYKVAYQRIKIGLDICASIGNKLDKLAENMPSQDMGSAQLAAPYISKEQLFQNCRSANSSLLVQCSNPEAQVFYSIDGSNPNIKLSKSRKITIPNNFNKKKIPEPDTQITVKLQAKYNGDSSPVNTAVITLHKDYEGWNGIEI